MSVDIVVVEEQEITRMGLASMFNATDIKVVAEATNGSEAVKMVSKHKPDVVLLDILRPEMDGFEVLERIRAAAPGSHVVMMSAYDNPTYVARAIAGGATDFVLKGASRRDLINVITAAASGRGPVREGEVQKIADTMGKTPVSQESGLPLTSRELQVLRHIALGLSNKEIARSLSISVETVKEHVQNILRKIPVTDRTQAAVWALRKGLV